MKKDKGFEIFYWNLSYRRKFIRTLWVLPFIIPATLLIWYASHSQMLTAIYFLLAALTGAIQAVYVYKKWKKDSD